MPTTTTTTETKATLPVTFNYLKPDINEPLFHIIAPTPGERTSNIEKGDYPHQVHDIRGHEHEYTLDSNAFQFAQDPISDELVEQIKAEGAGAATKVVKEVYYPLVEAFLKRLVGADRALAFDHNIRQRTKEETGRNGLPAASVQPAKSVHVDQTPFAAEQRLKSALPDEADELLKNNRFQIINVWRPLIPEVEDWPLALCDSRSVNYNSDVIPVELRFPGRRGETFVVKYDENHHWCFLSKQMPHEVVCIKCYDSKEDVARVCPHSAFDNPAAPKDAQFRESIEVRAFVFHKK